MNTNKNPKHSKATNYQQKFELLKKRILDVGFVAEGSLVKRFLTCGNPLCHCHNNPDERHGPYFQMTWKRNGKTISKFIPPKLVPMYKQWINNKKTLNGILKEIYRISENEIYSQLLANADKKDKKLISSVKKILRKK